MSDGTITKAAYEGDLVSRLRNWRGLHLAHGGDLFQEAADEIERLRLAIRRLADQDATVSVRGSDVIVDVDSPCPYVTGKTTRYCTLTPFTLTPEEREAVDTAEASLMRESTNRNTPEPVRQRFGAAVNTLRGLLERLK